MAEHDWKQLLDDPDIEHAINNVINRTGRTYYAHEPLLLDDLTSWAWDHAVTIAIKYDPDFTPRDPKRYWFGYLVGALRQAIVKGQHRTAATGRPDSARRAASRPIHLDAPSGDVGRPLSDVLSDPEPCTGDVPIPGFPDPPHREPGDDPTWWHPSTRDDPATILLAKERLEAALRHLQWQQRHAGVYVVETPATSRAYCKEPTCLKPVQARGLCNTHYAKHRQQWLTQQCTHETCTNGAHAKGLCSKHYLQEDNPDRPRCTVDGCTRQVRGRGLCATHYQAARRTGFLP